MAVENPSGLGAFDLPLRLPGQYFDKETNLHYNYFRDCYDPALGRFCEADPIGVTDLDMPLTPLNHLYGYVDNDPLRFIDDVGLAKKKDKDSASGTAAQIGQGVTSQSNAAGARQIPMIGGRPGAGLEEPA